MPNKGQDQKRPGNPDRTRSRAFAVAGPVLRALRVARGWTQEEASERAGVSDRLIRKAETGGPLELKSIALLAQLYSTPEAPLTPSELMPGRVDPAGEAAQSAAHEALVRRWWEDVWNQGRLEAIEELISPDCVLHAEGKVLHGREELRERTVALRAAFGDIHIDVQQVTVHGDWVISRWRVAMTHRGPWMGTPPTHQRVEVNGSTWIRVENGLLCEGWDYWEQQQAVEAVRGGGGGASRGKGHEVVRFRVQGSGFMVQGSWFRVQGSGFRVQGSGFRVHGSGFRVQGSGFRVQV